LAEEWLSTWVEERNYYAPVERVTAALPDDIDGLRGLFQAISGT